MVQETKQQVYPSGGARDTALEIAAVNDSNDVDFEALGALILLGAVIYGLPVISKSLKRKWAVRQT